MPTDSAFLYELFRGKPDSAQILIWTMPDKLSSWFTDSAAATQYAGTRNNCDVYYGLGISSKSYGATQRCKADDVMGISALWADIDILTTGHKKKNLPPDKDAAYALVNSLPLPPSACVFTGGGLHVYWFLDQPWIFTSDEDRQRAKTIATQWVDMVRTYAKQHAWDVDGVGDLSRVFRVPNTLNMKYTPPVPVVVESLQDRRYNVMKDIMPALLAVPVTGTLFAPKIEKPASDNAKLAPIGYHDFLFAGDAEPPTQKFDAIMDNLPKFKSTWERTRKDIGDNSPSGYDMSLAHMMAQVGWSPQEMINTIIACRRKHGDDLRMDRPDYYLKFTLPKARESAQYIDADDTLSTYNQEEEPHTAEGDNAAPLTEEAKDDILQAMSKKFGIGILRLERELSEPPGYRLITNQGAIHLGDVDGIIVAKRFQAAVAATTGVLIGSMKKVVWEEKFAKLLLKICVDVNIGPEATVHGQVKAWFAEYFTQQTPLESKEKVQSSRLPYRCEGHTYIFMSDFVSWLFTINGVKTTPKELGSMLRASGCEPTVHAFPREDARPTTRSVWMIPDSLDHERGDAK